MVKKPLKIGLTGGIGAGKTTVSNIFKSLGVPIFNSDEQSKKLIIENQDVIKEIIEEFGEQIIQKKTIHLRKLSHIIFANKKKLQSINNILHPRVIELFEKWFKKQNCKYIIKESALLFESNTVNNLDKIILVKAQKKYRIKRVMKRDNRTKEEVENIIRNQIKESKITNSVHYIINNHECELLVPKVLELHNSLSKL